MEKQLRKLQLTQVEILKVIDSICKENNIAYSLYAGTLLGAVRHKGFIPWDDDLDICMPRKDYDRFIKIWTQKNPEGYLLQNKENSPKFTQSFTKIRKNNTTFLQYESEIGKYHTGIFVDIFPIDRIPNGKIKRFLFKWDCMRYQLYTREFVPPKSNFIVKYVSQLMLGITPNDKRAAIRNKLLQKITKYSNESQLSAVAIETMSSLQTLYPADMLTNYITLPFEDGEFMCFAQWDESLRRKFGNYMQLPPEDERTWKHHPICIDFEKNYEKLGI